MNECPMKGKRMNTRTAAEESNQQRQRVVLKFSVRAYCIFFIASKLITFCWRLLDIFTRCVPAMLKGLFCYLNLGLPPSFTYKNTM